MKKISRDFGEDPDYSPGWRVQQAREYFDEYKTREERGEESIRVIPSDEKDQYVIDYVSLLVHGSCYLPEVKYAQSCFVGNDISGLGIQIECMFLGGLSVAQIAKEFKTKEKNIQCYLKLFFDVEEYMDSDSIMYSLIVPYNKWRDAREETMAHYTWMLASYDFGWDLGKHLFQRRIVVSSENTKKILDAMHGSVDLQASEYIFHARANLKARPCDFERHLHLTNAISMSEQGKTQDASISNGDFFRNALWNGIKEVSSTLSHNDPVRITIGEKERQIRLADKEKPKELRHFAPQPV